MKGYDHKKIELKWQKEWKKRKIYSASDKSKKKKFFSLIEFPYPSGAGLHVGHIRSNTAMDIVSRKRRMEGYNVLYPIGWDAFGLPTENFAIKTGIQPAKVTKMNTDIFRKQLKKLGFSFDWSREINTTDPEYYKWTQWIFLQFFKKGLAYKSKAEINWCPSCKIGLANEEVVDGKCERCGNAVEKREKEQWMLGITKYADRLDKDLDLVDYPERVKLSQRNWIGKSEGSEIDFKIANLQRNTKNQSNEIKVFTTRPDTIFGATYLVLAPEHNLVNELKSIITNFNEVEKYIKAVKKKTELERTGEDKGKTGVELKGVKAINPANDKEIPVWIADYVLPQYGTGAIMAVPAHDERDFEFAKKFGLPIRQVIEPIFIAESGDGAVKKDLPFVKRDAVCAIVFNPKNQKYLCISWKKFLMHGFVTGGVEKGENRLETAIREVQEETGFKNIKLIRDPDLAIHSLFYHRVKNENRWARFQYFFLELVDEEREEISEKENDIHEIVWKSKEELKDFLSVIEGKFVLNILDDKEYFHDGEGVLINSGKFDGMKSEEAQKEITKFVGGKTVTRFKLRDWVFSRQRYWGEPIPLVFCDKCGIVPVPEKDLPVLLPKVKSYQPTDTGESPLAVISKWVNTKCPKCKGSARRETDTMPNWAGSSWYYLRYVDPKNKKVFVDKKKLEYWSKSTNVKVKTGPVDWYNGGMEHTTLHLLYSRFWHKFLYDLKLVPTPEPYNKRTSHGMILGEGGVKMSKSIGNVINPDDIIKIYGADTLRIYEMFMGPFEDAVAWSTESIVGSRRFIEKIWRISEKKLIVNSEDNLKKLLHKTIKKVTEDIENMRFNTAISSMMILANEMEKVGEVSQSDFKMLLKILAPFAPHITEELWKNLGERKSIHISSWPKCDENLIKEEEVKIGVQVNGKVRSEMMISINEDEESIKNRAKEIDSIKRHCEGKEIRKIIYVKNRLVNIVV